MRAPAPLSRAAAPAGSALLAVLVGLGRRSSATAASASPATPAVPAVVIPAQVLVGRRVHRLQTILHIALADLEHGIDQLRLHPQDQTPQDRLVQLEIPLDVRQVLPLRPEERQVV